jgi:hypothetical protein
MKKYVCNVEKCKYKALNRKTMRDHLKKEHKGIYYGREGPACSMNRLKRDPLSDRFSSVDYVPGTRQ